MVVVVKDYKEFSQKQKVELVCSEKVNCEELLKYLDQHHLIELNDAYLYQRAIDTDNIQVLKYITENKEWFMDPHYVLLNAISKNNLSMCKWIYQKRKSCLTKFRTSEFEDIIDPFTNRNIELLAWLEEQELLLIEHRIFYQIIMGNASSSDKLKALKFLYIHFADRVHHFSLFVDVLTFCDYNINVWYYFEVYPTSKSKFEYTMDKIDCYPILRRFATTADLFSLFKFICENYYPMLQIITKENVSNIVLWKNTEKTEYLDYILAKHGFEVFDKDLIDAFYKDPENNSTFCTWIERNFKDLPEKKLYNRETNKSIIIKVPIA